MYILSYYFSKYIVIARKMLLKFTLNECVPLIIASF